MTPDSIQRIINLVYEQWQLAFTQWESKPQIVLHEEAEHVLFHTVCEWAGILPLDDEARNVRASFLP